MSDRFLRRHGYGQQVQDVADISDENLFVEKVVDLLHEHEDEPDPATKA
jgi:hypothetical protein